jgi:hypothetical protein
MKKDRLTLSFFLLFLFLIMAMSLMLIEKFHMDGVT